ncbi:MAG: glucan 1,4-alpha-glucosidase [Ktedonobacterales bacterium]|nr:glucan 1,4-alpha-glucosidase [Ktedonobacterales bacterium]
MIAHLRHPSRRLIVAGMTFLLLSTLIIGSHTWLTALAANVPTGVASDGPGALAYFDEARKDCVGTARNTTSKVWFTVANGVLSDVYYPTIDTTNVKTLQYVVTDGSTFTDVQTRDMTYSVQQLDAPSLGCRVTATAKSGKYRLVTDYLTDPAHNTVVMHTSFAALVGQRSDYRLYAAFDPTINGNGGGGAGNGGADNAIVDTSTSQVMPVAYDTNTHTNATNRDYATPVYSALDASTPFKEVSNGFAGTASDGLTQLLASHALTALDGTASNGNVTQTAQLALDANGNVTLALGFGAKQADAVAAARATLQSNFDLLRVRYAAGWLAYDSQLIPPISDAAKKNASQSVLQSIKQYYLSANVVKASEDKTFPGAIAAGLASPWGQAVSAGDPNNTYFGSYREVFGRDLYEAWTGLFADGDTQTARDTVNFLFLHQQLADGSLPRNSLLNGKLAPDSNGIQLDEASYPIIMAYQMHMTDATLYQQHIRPAANFVISHGPSFGVERWEEQTGYSPSTIAAEIAGLVAAADIATTNHDTASAAIWRATADEWQRSLTKWLVTTNGPLSSQPYYIRLSKTGDPNAAISYNVGNGGPTLDQRAIIDAGFLELVRLGLKSASDPTIANSLAVVDATIKTTTPSGPGWHRYNGDGYGDSGTTGQPWATTNQGTGHVWPLLTEERGEFALAHGDGATAKMLLATMQHFSSGEGLIPEQDWELPNLAASPYGTDPTTASIGFQNGQPAGSASPLTWSMASYVRLARDIATNRILERPADTYARYVTHQPGATTLTVTTPADQSSVSSGSVTVTGTSAPGNTVYVAATNTDTQSVTTTAHVAVGASGSFSQSIAVTGGVTVLTIAAVSPAGATAYAQRTIVYDFTPGTVVLDVTDPTNDDHGPGNYAYPTASDFHAGAFDIQEFRVIDDGTTVTFKLQVRDLSATFGSPLGAQLVDVYAHDPAAAAGDAATAAAYASRNYTIAGGAAWSKLVEVQGFGQKYVDAHGNALGSVNISANAISRFITFSVPASSFGHPTSGWGFTVVLTGQDGFSSDQARGFTATPGGYSFGVCATSSTDPHCTVDPNMVPKAMDVLTPTGVSQADEFDYTLHQPVTLQDIIIP